MMTYGWRSSTHNAVYFTTTKLGVYIDNDNDMLRYFDAFALMLRNERKPSKLSYTKDQSTSVERYVDRSALPFCRGAQPASFPNSLKVFLVEP